MKILSCWRRNKVDKYIEEMVTTGLVKPFKLRGKAQAVFRMLRVLAECRVFTPIITPTNLTLLPKQNRQVFLESEPLPKPDISQN
jgi:hypothetical protein